MKKIFCLIIILSFSLGCAPSLKKYGYLEFINFPYEKKAKLCEKYRKVLGKKDIRDIEFRAANSESIGYASSMTELNYAARMKQDRNKEIARRYYEDHCICNPDKCQELEGKLMEQNNNYNSWEKYNEDCKKIKLALCYDYQEFSVRVNKNLDIRQSKEQDTSYTSSSSSSGSSGNETGRDGRYVAYDNGTVMDTDTGLMWAAEGNGFGVKWAEAKAYCKNYTGGGYTDWRMPTPDELAGLYDKSKVYKTRGTRDGPGNKIHLTRLINLTDPSIWTSETRVRDQSYASQSYTTQKEEAAYFYFDFGSRYWSDLYGYSFRCLPVRGGK